ncbi:hypothetical protein MBGDN05_00437 [Thermoplasmatales archaeon SCGC AB-539-N05]|nr:hypothetical protein MBGDN05_00437 [Thermoplasmatales archaeon SCGC AB-539-N05]
MRNSKLGKLEAAVIIMFFLGSMVLAPFLSATQIQVNKKIVSNNLVVKKQGFLNPRNRYDVAGYPPNDEGPPVRLDTYYVPEEDVSLAGEQNDVGYNCDAGDTIQRSLPIYIGEPVDQTVPGRGRIGTLDSSDGDENDWFRFTVCAGQSMQASVSGGFDFEFCDTTGNPVGQSYTATETGMHFIHIFTSGGSGDYIISLSLTNQNDAGKGSDAGNSIGQATAINPGSYTGYMDSNDVEDWYSFNANSGQGIFVNVEPVELKEGDFDIHLYNPSGQLVHSAQYYGDDELEFPADASGTWKIKLDIWPGWDTSKWPSNYFLYGSGAYELELSVGGSAESPPSPIPQPEIYPVAQTFKITNDPGSNKDEYAYIAAIPAANYLKNNKRYVSPIVYTGDNSKTNWFGDVDDTTQYLLDDWNAYLSRHDMTATEYQVKQDPVQAAADIATKCWSSSNTAVLAVDGSGFEDTIETVVQTSSTVRGTPEVEELSSSNEKLHSDLGYTMLLGNKWCAVALEALSITKSSGDISCTMINNIFPQFLSFGGDFWPTPYDTAGEAIDVFHPVTVPGIWSASTELGAGDFSTYRITKIAGDRYKIPVETTDCSIKATVTTNNPSPLRVYLVDPQGNVRRPMVPHYNGGDINPIHFWNGGHWQHDFGEFRSWKPEISTVHVEEVYYPVTGKWSAIVVPGAVEYADNSYSYDITIEIRKHNSKRRDAALSAANAAVIASLENAPLLYVTETSVPSATSNALSALGAGNIIFVNINDVSSASPGGTEYNTLQAVIDNIKTHSENYITITSLGTGDGYFAPAAMIAAYHGSPVLSIGEIPDVYNTLDMLAAWREYAGDYYHGANAISHPPKMDEPFDLKEFIQGILQGDFPALGFDLHKRTYSKIHDGIVAWIEGYGLEQSGREAFIFVAPRDGDIRNPICRAMTGIESYAGHIPVETPGFASALICRDILYPAIIYANPGRDVTSSCMFNFADGREWTLNAEYNGEKRINVYTSRNMKRSLSSHGRFYEGHTLWENLLERYNTGCSVLYHCSHGTGGSGICCMYENIAEQFPLVEPRYEHLKDFNWWDGWRGYMYDDSQTKTPRWGGFTWCNAKEPNLYDIVHFKWCDQLFDNLHSQFNLWQSCTTGEHEGPMVYLEHGAALWYGNAESGLCPQEELYDDWWFTDMMENGITIGESLSKYVWYHQRDYTAKEGSQERSASMYGSSSLTVDNCQVLYGDPAMICYSPEWVEPIPLNP